MIDEIRKTTVETENQTAEVTYRPLQKPTERSRDKEALEILVSDIQSDPNATSAEKKLASALLGLKE